MTLPITKFSTHLYIRYISMDFTRLNYIANETKRYPRCIFKNTFF